MITLLLYVALAIGISFLCSLLEAAMFSVRLSTLTEKKAQGSRGAALLLDLKSRRVDDAISAVLILNTLANTLGATLAGAQAARVFGSAWVGVFSGVLTFLILVVSEIIPKTLGAVYSRGLTGFVGWTLHILTRLMRPALTLSRSLTRLLTPGAPSSISRGELAAVIATAIREGTLSSREATLFTNLLRFHEVPVRDVMTPRTVVTMVPEDARLDELVKLADLESFSRIPTFGQDRDDVTGYVLMRDVYRAVARGEGSLTAGSLRRPILYLPEFANSETALRRFLEGREPIAMVLDEHGAVEGLVTLEDLTETILGSEIVDESDRIVDLRRAAEAIRDQRLRRLESDERGATAAGGAKDSPAGGAPTKEER